jgi:hypothetical protein
MPLNGGFETSTDAAFPPDHWTVSGGTWATNITAKTDANGVSANRYLCFETAAPLASAVQSASFPVEGGRVYSVSAWWRLASRDAFTVVAVRDLKVTWLDNTGSVISTTTVASTDGGLDVTTGGSWQLGQGVATAPSATRFAYVSAVKTSGLNSSFELDSVRMELLRPAGVLTWGNASLPTANGTTYLTPGFASGVAPANAIKIHFPFVAILSNLHVRVRAPASGVSYNFWIYTAGGLASSVQCTLTTSSSASDTANTVYVSKALDVWVQVTTTVTGAPVSPADVIVTAQVSSLPTS